MNTIILNAQPAVLKCSVLHKRVSFLTVLKFEIILPVMCPRGLGLVLEAPRGQGAVALALALALITKSLALALALVPSPWPWSWP